MTYLGLARRYRPQVFEELVGQPHIATTLKNALRTQRLAQAYLFAGPRGVGKTTTARILAKAINCPQPRDNDPCNRCELCLEIGEGRSLDVLEIDGASNRGIDEVRELRERVKYAPARGARKIYIIDEVHMLTKEAFNALLKTLEEPPSHVLFVLATTEPHKVPATVLSRCQRFDFRQLSVDEIRGRLEEVLRSEGVTYEMEALRLLARRAEGSLRDALGFVDQVLTYATSSVTAEAAVQVLGLVPQALYPQLMEGVVSQNPAQALSLVARVVAEGYDLVEFYHGLIEYLRALLVAKVNPACGPEPLADGPAVEVGQAAPASTLEAEDLLRMLNLLVSREFQFRSSPHPRIYLEALLVRLALWPRSVAINQLLLTLGEGTALPVQESQPVSPRPSSRPTGATTLEAIQASWPDVVERVRAQKSTLGSILAQARPLRVEGRVVVLGIDARASFQAAHLQGSDSLALVEEILGQSFASPLEVKLELQDAPEEPRPEMAGPSAGGSGPPAGSATLQQVMDVLDAEIIG